MRKQMLNTGSYGKSSKYKGVDFRPEKGKFRARRKFFENQKHVYLGYFDKDEDDAIAYDQYVWNLYKDTENAPFVYLNFPDLMSR